MGVGGQASMTFVSRSSLPSQQRRTLFSASRLLGLKHTAQRSSPSALAPPLRLVLLSPILHERVSSQASSFNPSSSPCLPLLTPLPPSFLPARSGLLLRRGKPSLRSTILFLVQLLNSPPPSVACRLKLKTLSGTSSSESTTTPALAETDSRLRN